MARDQESLKKLLHRRDAAWEAGEECEKLDIPESATGWKNYSLQVQEQIDRQRLQSNGGLRAVFRRLFGRQPQ